MGGENPLASATTNSWQVPVKLQYDQMEAVTRVYLNKEPGRKDARRPKPVRPAGRAPFFMLKITPKTRQAEFGMANYMNPPNETE